jgi:hypothetical protein
MHATATIGQPWTPISKSTRPGKIYTRYLRESEILPGISHLTRLVKYESGSDTFYTPRHRHNYEQIRVTVRGQANYGRSLVGKDGDVAYFPEGAHYGPQRIENADLLVIQWGPEWVSRAQNDAAIDELKTRGEFKNGIYTYLDSSGTTRNLDGIRAVWEHVNKRPLVFPKPRYREPILMVPSSFAWNPVGDTFAEKILGRFTERDLVVRLVRWERDGELTLPAGRTQLVFTLRGDVTAAGTPFGPESVLWSEAGDSDHLGGEPGSEALVIEFPLAATPWHTDVSTDEVTEDDFADAAG